MSTSCLIEVSALLLYIRFIRGEPTKHIPLINSTVATRREQTTGSASVGARCSSRGEVMLKLAVSVFKNICGSI